MTSAGGPPGALHGIRVVEIASEGPAAFCAMLLADLGADVLRVDRPADARPTDDGRPPRDAVLGRGRRSVALDLKHPDGVDTILRLVERADVLVEGFRPGVAERLGVGPDACSARNPKLVYGRMTGWGQDGPLAQTPGHDINFIAVAGLLSAVGRAGQPPTPPLALAGDLGGGGAYLAVGLLAALLEAQRSGRGQVVDAAIVDGAASLMGVFFGLHSTGDWSDERGTNLLDGGAPFYDSYETADGAWVAIGALEPRFYAELIDRLGLAGEDLPDQYDAANWPRLRKRLAETFLSRTRQDWCDIFAGSETCFAPVLSLGEAPDHPHNRSRGAFVELGGVVHPAPAPRLSRTPGQIVRPAPRPGQDTATALVDWGLTPAEVERLLAAKAAGQASEAG